MTLLLGSEANEVRHGAVAVKALDDGREAVIYSMLLGNARICIGPPGAPYYDDAYCYDGVMRAVVFLTEWGGEGEPDGWKRHIGSGRRREYDDQGRIVREWVNP